MMRMLRSERGFTLVEAMVSTLIIMVTAAGALSFTMKSKKNVANNELSSRFAYFEELLVSRGTLIASNLLFWSNNVTNACTGMGKLLYGRDFSGGSDNLFVQQDFSIPLHFEGHDLYPFSGTAESGEATSVTAVKSWYTKNAAQDANDPTVKLLKSCLSADTISSTADLTGKGPFQFCMVLDATYDPGSRQAMANGGRRLSQFVVAQFTVTPKDLYSGQNLLCENKDSSAISQFLPNRSFELVVAIGAVSNSDAAFVLQQRFVTTRSYMAPKQSRMLINCGHCLNVGDPAFQFECAATVASGCL
jgi:type II secretory pathway pseudopilin PulG